MKERDGSIDIIRGVAIFCVVLGHLPIGEFLGRVIYLFHMPCFFIISGYLSFSSMQENNFYWKLVFCKVKRLLIPFFVWSGIAFVFNVIIRFILHETKSISILELEKMFWEIIIEAKSVWFLVVLFFIFIFWGIFRLLENKFTGRFTEWIYLVGWLILCITLPNFLFRFNKLKYFMPYFGIGYLMYKHKLLLPLEKYKYLLNINACVFPLSIYMFKDSAGIDLFYSLKIENMNFIEALTGITLSFMGIMFLIFISMLISNIKLKNIVKNWGIYSLDIYLIHMFFIKILHWEPSLLNEYNYFYQFLYNFVYAALAVSIITFIVRILSTRLKLYQWITGK